MPEGVLRRHALVWAELEQRADEVDLRNRHHEREGEGESEGEGEGERAAGARLTARGGAEGSLAAIVSEALASSAIVSEAVASSAWVGVIGEGVGEGA